MLLKDKIAVVTGGTSRRGLGRATAQLFARHGARVAVLDLDGAGAVAAAAELDPDHLGLACGVTDKAGGAKGVTPASWRSAIWSRRRSTRPTSCRATGSNWK